MGYKIGVIGAGTMGSGIAQKAAQEGMNVVMVDLEQMYVDKGMKNIRSTLDEAVKRKIFSPEQTEEIMARIKGTTNLEDVKDTDLVIEVVFEDPAVKEELFRKLDSICEQKTIFASNTSTFSISELASSVKRKDRFVGLHFFYHPAKNRLLEVIPGRKTSASTLEFSNSFSNVLGKTVIDVKDSPGFAVNRFFVPWLNEAARLLEEGVANIPSIDATARNVFKIGMGPFELMNATGVPIALHSATSLSTKLGEFYSPSKNLEEQVELGEPWNLEGEADDENYKNIEERLLGTIFTLACQLVDEGVATIEDIDRGAKVGLRWRRGPFEMMNRYGIENSYGIVESFIKKYPDLKFPTILEKQKELGKPWEFKLVDLEVKGEIARIIINRPEAMNAINEDVMKQLDKKFTKASSDPNVKAVVLEGAGKAFVAGADIGYFIKKIDQNKIDDIVEFTRYGHSVLNKIDESDKLVIVKLDGLALGGGAEIALAADTIVATEKGSIGFPETGIGIYPGLGGTQRTTRYVGKPLAKFLIFTGAVLDAKTAESIGLVEYVVPPEDIDKKISELARGKEPITKSSRGKVGLPDDFVKISMHFTDKNVDELLSEDDLDHVGKKIFKKISRKAPIALKLANDIIDKGSELDLKEGLQLELDGLKEIFSTDDAYEGLKSVLERRRPKFEGE
jgi:enoyl-CoA hydratase/3-hydroxyacyl-CoA dehydrogenase